MASRKLCTWNAIFLVPWVLYSLLESHNPFDIWESTPTVAHNSCCHVSSRHGTHGKTCVFCSCAWYCHWQGRVGAERCWQPHMCICVLTYEYIHTCDYIGSDTDAEMQRCREDKGESTAAGGWEVRRSSRPSVQVCLDECGSAVLFDVPPSWLMDCGRVELSGLLTSHSSTRWIWCLLTVRHTAVTMNPGWWERGARTERSWKSRMVSWIQLHYLFGVCGVFEVSFRFGSMCRSKLTLKQRHFDFVLQKTFWSLSYEKKACEPFLPYKRRWSNKLIPRLSVNIHHCSYHYINICLLCSAAMWCSGSVRPGTFLSGLRLKKPVGRRLENKQSNKGIFILAARGRPSLVPLLKCAISTQCYFLTNLTKQWWRSCWNVFETLCSVFSSVTHMLVKGAKIRVHLRPTSTE